jgi:chromosome segregation ATPase
VLSADSFPAGAWRTSLPVRQAGRGRLRLQCPFKQNAMEELDLQPTSEEPSSDEFSRLLDERRQQALDLLATQREQFDHADAALEAHLAEMERHFAARLSDTQQEATNHDEKIELDQLAKRLRDQAEELTSQQAALAADRAEIASRHAELHIAREQLARQHQDRVQDEQQEREQLSRRAAELQSSEAKLKQTQRELTQTQEEFRHESRRKNQELADREHQEVEQLDRRAAELQALETKLKQAEYALAAAQEEHHSEVRQFALRREHIDQQQLRLEKELEELEARREETRTQRRRIAQQLRIERTTQSQERELTQSEVDRQRAALQKEIERGRLQISQDREQFEQEINRARQQLRRDREQLEEEESTLEKVRRQWEETRRQADKNRTDQSADLLAAGHEIQQLTAQLAQAQQTVEDAEENLNRLQQEHDSLKLQLSQKYLGAETSTEESPALQAERDALAVRVGELECQLAAAEKRLAEEPLAVDTQHSEDLQRRFEMAVDDVRQLKRRNSELEEELANLEANAQQKPSRAESTFTGDWEATKKRLLAELQEDTEQTGGGQLAEDERLTVEGTIRITDEMIMQRDQEIAQLKDQLTQQGNQLVAAEQTTVVTAVEAEVLDQDAVIQQERQRLVELQHEWQEKLRQAEVDISVQRARLARERTDVDEQLRTLEEEKTALASQKPGESSAPNSSKKPGHRWLARLGLKESDREK